jgi:hypothetical protein
LRKSVCVEISRENLKFYLKPKYMVDSGHFQLAGIISIMTMKFSTPKMRLWFD